MRSPAARDCAEALIIKADELTEGELSKLAELLGVVRGEHLDVLVFTLKGIAHARDPLDPDAWALALEGAVARAAALKLSGR